MSPRRTNVELDGDHEAGVIALALGRELRSARRRARLTQERLGERIGLRRTRIGELERGEGTTAPLGLWVRLGKAIGRPLAVGFSRDLSSLPEPVDAGHLGGQEVVLGLARATGRTGFFELQTPAASGVVDVGIRDDRQRVLMVIEIWNRMTDLGAASRSTSRKVAEVAASLLPETYRVASCWLLVDSAANRAIVRRFPEIIRARFPGASARWVRALADGAEPPQEAGIAWVDARTGRVSELRLRS